MSLFTLLAPAIIGFLPITTVLFLGLMLPPTAHKKSCNPINRVLLMIKLYCRNELTLGVRGVKLREWFDFSIHAAFCVGVGVLGAQLEPTPELGWVRVAFIGFGTFMTLACVIYYYRIGSEACARERARPVPAASAKG